MNRPACLNGKPVNNALVAVYDRNHQRAGMREDFKRFTATTDESGWAAPGILPQDYVCVEVFPRRDDLDSSYVVIFRDTRYRQTKPARYNAVLEERRPADDGAKPELLITFTLRAGVDIDFEVVDADTQESLFWPEIFFQDERSNWWNFSLIDGGGQYDFVAVGPEVAEAPLLVIAQGYFSQPFTLDGPLQPGKKFPKKIAMKKAPDLRIQVLTRNGEPAANARLTWSPNEQGLLTTQGQAKRVGHDGTVLLKFPPAGEYTTLYIRHDAGAGTVKLSELNLKDAVTDEPFEVTVRLQ